MAFNGFEEVHLLPVCLLNVFDRSALADIQKQVLYLSCECFAVKSILLTSLEAMRQAFKNMNDYLPQCLLWAKCAIVVLYSVMICI